LAEERTEKAPNSAPGHDGEEKVTRHHVHYHLPAREGRREPSVIFSQGAQAEEQARNACPLLVIGMKGLLAGGEEARTSLHP